MVTAHFPGQVIGQVDGVHVDILMPILAHRFYHLPSDLIARFLRTNSIAFEERKIEKWKLKNV